MPQVHVIYYTDPACPFSWGAEPALRRLQAEFGEDLRITYVMGGLAREFRRPHETLAHVLDAAELSGMPVDPRLWLDSPPRSSYPACLAVKAAAEQGLDGPYLRAVREGLMVERRRLDNADALADVARRVAGLDVGRFAVDLGSNATVERFGADLERVRGEHPERHNAAGRVPFPSFFVEEAGEGTWDEAPAERLAALVRQAGAAPQPLPRAEEALRRFGRMAAAEVAAVCDLPGPRAPAELWRLALEWRARPVRHLTGELWAPA